MEGTSVLLEPYYAFTIEAEASLCGRILGDIRRMHGECGQPEIAGERVSLTGKVPVSTSMDYPAELTAFSHGDGAISLTFAGYEPCHNADEVIRAKAYDPERDTENPADSVFCSHGAGYTVKWEEAPQKMHLQLRGNWKEEELL